MFRLRGKEGGRPRGFLSAFTTVRHASLRGNVLRPQTDVILCLLPMVSVIGVVHSVGD